MTDIDQLKKAFQQAISTSASVAASNEPLTRRDAVQSGQVLSAPVVQGGLGSWVASSGYPLASVTPEGVQLGAVAPSRNSFEMAPGLPGVPDVDFVPYNWNTNRFGGKGGALLGHPISWEVVGPTLKSPYCDWQWNINTAGANDTLTLAVGPNPLGGAPASVQAAYKYSATFDAEGGLYVLLTFTGENFTGALTAGRNPITPTLKYRAPFEIFRVATIAGSTILLRGEKRLSDYYGIPANPSCRAITLIRPKVTRLAPLPAPKNGTGQTNRIFVFVPPEVSATSEYNPPYDAGAGSWLGGGFDVAGTLPVGLAADYGGANPLPVPRPVAEVDGTIDTVVVGDPAKWVINVSSVPSPSPPIVRVYGVTRASTNTLSNGTDSNCLGYFYVTKIGAGPSLTLRRVPEVDPDTGAVFWGNGPYDSGPGSVDVRVQFFESINSLFTDTSLNFQKLAAARLANLIDPRTAGPSIAYRDTSGTNAVPASKPDRAIFNTKPGEDPGNLLDLGFRVVYFPAKVVGGNAVPDFNKPLDSEDVQLTPNPTSRQYVETDYSAGVAYLSDVPDSGDPACQVASIAAPFTATNNPRQEIVLFAACVPYSMEEGQTGDGIRVTASSLKSIEVGFGEDDLADVYGRRLIADCLTAPGVFTPPGFLLTDLASLADIPPSGFFFLVDATGGALTTPRVGPYYYQSTSLAGTVQLNGVAGPAYTITADTKIVLQRSLWSFAPDAASADTVRGASKRISTLSFKSADVTFGADGSVSIEPRVTLQKAYEAGNTIVATSGEGEVRIRTVDEPGLINLQIQKLPTVASTTGDGLGIGMNANTSGDAIGISQVGEGKGISILHGGTLVGADGIRINQSGATSAYGLRVEMSDVASAGYGVSIQHNGTFGALEIVHSGTAGTANGAEISLTGATTATGLSIGLSNAGATGDGLSIENSGAGRGIFLKASGSGNAIDIYDSASALVASVGSTGIASFYNTGLNTFSTISGGTINLYDPPGPPANTTALNPTSVSNTDGTFTSTLGATDVMSGGTFSYQNATAKSIVVPMSDGCSESSAGSSEWDFQYDGATFTSRWSSLLVRSEIVFPLPIPNNCSIVNVLVVVDVANAAPLAVNRLQARLQTLVHDFTTPAVPTPAVIGEECDNGGTGVQLLNLRTGPNGGLGFGVDQVVGYTAGTKEWLLRIVSSNAGVGDLIYSIQVQLKLDSPAQL